jgi:hypothetical protein
MMLLHLTVFLVTLVLNPDGTYYTHEYQELRARIYECEAQKPKDIVLLNGREVRFFCILIECA